MNDREKLLRIDGCRTEHGLTEGDSAPPSFNAAELDAVARDLFERVRDCDTAVRQTLDDVPLPQGLSSRILDRLKAAREEASLLDPSLTPPLAGAKRAGDKQDDGPAVLPFGDRPRVSRRRWLTAAAVVVATSVGLGMYSYLYPPAQELTNEDLWEEFLKRFAEQESQAKGSHPMTTAPRRSFPVCDLNAGVSVRGWHNIYNDVLQRDGVCYYLRTAEGQTAVLWVLPLEGNPAVAPNLATAALQASRNTADRAVTAWRSRDVIYVLVAQGESLTPFVTSAGLT